MCVKCKSPCRSVAFAMRRLYTFRVGDDDDDDDGAQCPVHRDSNVR